MQSTEQVFQHWLYQPVSLTIATAGSGVPVQGVIVGETKESVRFRINDRWEIEIEKSMVLMVEQDPPMDIV
jgi:hypothetical protein